MQRYLLFLLFGLFLAACEDPAGPDDTGNPGGSSTVAMTQLTQLPMAGGDVTGISITPDNRIIAAIDGRLYSINMSGGAMQTLNNEPIHTAIALAPSGELYTVTDKNFRTYDLAAGTQREFPIDPAGPFAIGRRIESVEILMAPSGEPYVKIINNTPQTYIYHSTDKGASWTPVKMPQGFRYNGGLGFAPNGDLLMSDYQGLYRSSDHGTTWTTSPAPRANYGGSLMVTANGDIYHYPAGGGGLVVSRNGGASFTELTTFNAAPYFMSVQQGPDGNLYALASRGAGSSDPIMRPTSFLRSTDGGATWKHMMYAQGRTFAMRGSQIVIGLGVSQLSSRTNGGILVSQNNGGTWTPIGSEPVETIHDIGFDKSGSLMILADNGLFRQTSSGWQAFGTQPFLFARFAATKQGVMVLANQTSIFYSSDNGATWTEHMIQEYTPGIDPAAVTSLISRSNGEFIMSITSYSDGRGYSNGHLYRIGSDGIPVRIMVPHTFPTVTEDRNGKLYAAEPFLNPFTQTYSSKSYESADGGATWTERTKAGTGWPGNSQNRYFGVGGTNEYYLRSADSDQKTELKLEGFTSQGNYITRVAFGPDDRLYLVTRDKGMFISNGPVK